MTQRKFLPNLILSLSFFGLCLPTATAAPDAPDVNDSGYILAERTSNKTSRKPKKKRKKDAPAPEIESREESNPPEQPANALANQRTFRGLLGLYMGSKSILVFGAGATLPYSKTIALDGGFDYLKQGNEVASVSLMRFSGGAGYIITTGPDSTFRVGGRAGLMNVTFSYSVPAIFEGDEGSSGSESSSALYAEGRLAYEIKLGGGLVAGGELQVPLFIANDDLSEIDGIAIYGSLGMAF